MAMDSTLKLDPSCVFFNDSVLSYTSMGPPTLSTDLGSRRTSSWSARARRPRRLAGLRRPRGSPQAPLPRPGLLRAAEPRLRLADFPHRPLARTTRSRRRGAGARAARRRRPKGGPLPPALPGLAGPAAIPRSRALVRPHVDGPRAQDVPLAAAGAPGRLLGRQPALEAREAAPLTLAATR